MRLRLFLFTETHKYFCIAPFKYPNTKTTLYGYPATYTDGIFKPVHILQEVGFQILRKLHVYTKECKAAHTESGIFRLHTHLSPMYVGTLVLRELYLLNLFFYSLLYTDDTAMRRMVA